MPVQSSKTLGMQTAALWILI